MRRIAFVLMAALAAACAPRQAAQSCDTTATREIAVTADGAVDVLTVQTLGPSCDKAIGLITVATEDGHPIWAWTAPMWRAFGDTFAETTDDAQAFVNRWAETARLETTGAAPAWPAPEGVHVTLDRLTYEDIRARDLPMLCHVVSVGRETCVFWEPAAAAAGVLMERDVPEGASPDTGLSEPQSAPSPH